MARRPRIILPGEAHHVTQRGNRRQTVFFSESDYKSYIKLLWANADLFKFDVWAYCLMPNHVHLLLVPNCEKSFRDGMAQLHQSYARSVNESRGWQGHLWQGRFFSCPVGPIHVPIVARYIELNPVRAGICETASDFKWSSAKMSCEGRNGKNGFAPIYAPGGTWSEYLAYDPNDRSNEELKTIRESSRIGRPYGSDEFLEQIEKRTGVAIRPQKRGPKSQSPAMYCGN